MLGASKAGLIAANSQQGGGGGTPFSSEDFTGVGNNLTSFTGNSGFAITLTDVGSVDLKTHTSSGNPAPCLDLRAFWSYGGSGYGIINIPSIATDAGKFSVDVRRGDVSGNNMILRLYKDDTLIADSGSFAQGPAWVTKEFTGLSGYSGEDLNLRVYPLGSVDHILFVDNLVWTPSP